jgi:ribosomal RNA-processing protein 7
MHTSQPLIKGYLPVRLKVPEDTFFYVKQHHGDDATTLFVANCPVHCNVDTKLLLTSIFGRYGDVTRVTVIKNPRQQQQQQQQEHSANPLLLGSSYNWTDKFRCPTCMVDDDAIGKKFAHVKFRSAKEMKQTLRVLCEIMRTEEYITLDPIEMQTLADETDHQRQRRCGEEDLSTEEGPSREKKRTSGIAAIVQRYKSSRCDRDELLQECNDIMSAFETAEEEEQRRQNERQVDDDGFVTITYKNTKDKSQLEDADTVAARGGRSRKQRSRSKKSNGGAQPLEDFYRFQTKDNRKRSLQELREKFEQDLARVKKLKEEKKYSPF